MNFLRRIVHIYKSGCLVIGLEHFLVMFPSAMLVAKLANSTFGAVVGLPTILFGCGVGTLLFILFTKGKFPFFLGPSFCYIGFVSYQVASINSADDIEMVRSTILYGYLMAGILLLLLSFLYHSKTIKGIFDILLPSTVMGPAISLIGLELADMAASDSGLLGDNNTIKIIAITTVSCIIIFSLLRHHFLQNASVLIGVIIGCIFATRLGQANWSIPQLRNFHMVIPPLYLSYLSHLPQNWITLLIAVIPCTLIAFIESLGRISVYNGMLKRDEKAVDENSSNDAISKHAITNTISAIINMMPSSIYAENMAIMTLHSADLSTKHKKVEDDDSFINNCYSVYSVYPYIIASIICIIVALFNWLQELFLAIPVSVIGGMELFIFGLITAPGIQMLVDQQINYKKISNQIITASVLLAGISGVSFSYGSLTLKGMSLGLFIGVLVNIVTILLGYLGLLNEKYALLEILDIITEIYKEDIIIQLYSERSEVLLSKEVNLQDFPNYIRQKEISNLIKNSNKIVINGTINRKEITFLQEFGRIDLRVQLLHRYQNRLYNDYPNITIVNISNKYLTIIIDEYLSKRLLIDILKNAI